MQNFYERRNAGDAEDVGNPKYPVGGSNFDYGSTPPVLSHDSTKQMGRVSLRMGETHAKATSTKQNDQIVKVISELIKTEQQRSERLNKLVVAHQLLEMDPSIGEAHQLYLITRDAYCTTSLLCDSLVEELDRLLFGVEDSSPSSVSTASGVEDLSPSVHISTQPTLRFIIKAPTGHQATALLKPTAVGEGLKRFIRNQFPWLQTSEFSIYKNRKLILTTDLLIKIHDEDPAFNIIEIGAKMLGGARKGKKKQVQNTTIVVQPIQRPSQKGKQKKKRKLQLKTNSPFNLNKAEKHFLECLLHPFNPRANNCRMPNYGNVMNTTCQKMLVEFGIASAASAGAVYQSVIFYPNPMLCMYVANVTSTGLIINSLAGYPTGFGFNPNYYYGATLASMQGVWSSARVVAAGIEVESVQAGNIQQQGLVFGSIPLVNDPDIQLTTLHAYQSSTILNYFVTGISTTPTNILIQGNSKRLTGPDIFGKPATMAFLPTTSESARFMNLGNNDAFIADNDYNQSDGVYVNGDGTIDLSKSNNIVRAGFKGWNAIAMNMAGLSNSQGYLRCRMVVHMEGVPIVNTSASMVAVPPVGDSPQVDLDKVYAATRRHPLVEFVQETATNVGRGVMDSLIHKMRSVEIMNGITY